MPEAVRTPETRVDEIRFRMYLTALSLTAAAFAVRMAFRAVIGGSDSFSPVVAPVMVAVFGSTAVYLKRRKRLDFGQTARISTAGYALGCAVALARYFHIYIVVSKDVNPLLVLPGFSHWLPAIFALGYVAFDTKRASRANAVLFCAVVGLGLAYAVPAAVAGNLHPLESVTMMALADAILLVLMVTLIRVKDEYEAARLVAVRAEHAREIAESASAAKSEFLSRVSHELRTPLNSILGFGQLLAMQDLTPRQRQGVEQILRGGHHLLELINEVLDISRIETGRMSLSVEPVAVREVVGDVVDLVGPLAAARRVHVDSVDTPAHVMADRQRLKQVLLNLLANAIKYCDEGDAVRILIEHETSGQCRIAVLDNGPGLSPGQMARLFRPFERLGAEQSNVEGTGLGLTLSKGLAEAMGGTLGVASKVGVGSSFWIELPLAAPPIGPRTAAVPEAPAACVDQDVADEREPSHAR